MKKISIMIAALLILTAVTAGAADQKKDPAPLVNAKAALSAKDSTAAAVKADSLIVTTADTPAPKIIAYYFHGIRRCPTCRKLEAYSQEAVQTGFAEELKTGKMEWRVVNIEESPNEHYEKDYQLYTKSVILSRVENGKEAAWKNLDRIWELVGDKEAFVKYIQDEVRLMAADSMVPPAQSDSPTRGK
ncbi:MAG: hypothetical protein GYA46_12465 [candidate division Zixibacteria bacterium]|nr:hypothetical protein [candidate division Zixibacteria bacterium]